MLLNRFCDNECICIGYTVIILIISIIYYDMMLILLILQLVEGLAWMIYLSLRKVDLEVALFDAIYL